MAHKEMEFTSTSGNEQIKVDADEVGGIVTTTVPETVPHVMTMSYAQFRHLQRTLGIVAPFVELCHVEDDPRS